MKFLKRFDYLFEKNWLSWVISFGGIGLALLAWHLSVHSIEDKAYIRFKYRTEEIKATILDRITIYENVLRGGVGLFASSEEVTRNEWHDYITSLQLARYFPGIQGVGYAEMISESDLPHHISKMHSLGFKNYKIRPEGKRNLYSSIIYLEPFDYRNQRAFGYDMFSEPTRRAAMKRARDYGEIVLSGKVTLVQETSNDVQAGFLLYAPLYKKNRPLRTVEDRRNALLGFVYSPFRAGDFMKEVLPSNDRSIQLEVYDGVKKSSETILYDTDNVLQANLSTADSKFTVEYFITVGYQNWTLIFYSGPDFYSQTEKWLPRIILAAGTIFSIFLFLIYSVMREKLIAQKLVEQKNDELELIIDSIPGFVFLKKANGKVLKVNKYYADAFNNTKDSFISQMIPCDAIDITKNNDFRNDDASIILNNKPKFNIEERWKTPTGEKWFLSSLIPIKSNDLEEISLLNVSIDITEYKKIQLQLDETQKQLAAIISQVYDYAIFLIKPDGTVASWNLGAQRLKGYSEEEIIGKSHQCFFTDEDIASGKPVALLERAKYEGHHFETAWLVRKNGTRFLGEISATAMYNSNNELVCFVKVTRDITEKTRQEEELRQLNRDFIALLENTDDYIYFKDSEGRFRFCSQALASTSHFHDWKSMIGRDDYDVFVPEVAKAHSFEDTEIYKTRKPLIGKINPLTLKDGTELWLSTSKWPVFDPKSEKIIGLFGISRDITNRVFLEQEVVKAETRFRSIFLNSPDALLIMESETLLILDCNRATESMLKMDKRSIIGLTPAQLSPELQPNGGRSVDIMSLKMNQARENGSTRFEWMHKKMDGDNFWVDVYITLIFLDGKEVLLVSWRDMTEFKKLEDNLRRSNKELEQFAYITSHDLQEPLRSIGGFTSLIAEEYKGKLSADADEYIYFITSGTRRMQRMITDLLSYSKVQKHEIQFSRVELFDVCQSVKENLNDLIARKNAKIHCEMENYLYADSNQLELLFQNLVRNAINYSREGVSPEVYLKSSLENDYVVVDVIDNGIGIDSKFYEKIFEVFQRLHSSSEYEGSGIGLSICKKIVERHKGSITVTSEVGKGSTFTVRIPRQRQNQEVK